MSTKGKSGNVTTGRKDRKQGESSESPPNNLSLLTNPPSSPPFSFHFASKEPQKKNKSTGRGYKKGLVLSLSLSWGLVLRSEEHTSELQSLMRISYAVFCLKKKTNSNTYKYEESEK